MVLNNDNEKVIEDGFTLVEVLASIVIISVILLGVINLVNFTNKTAVSNNSKLISINLAKATMERVKIEPYAYFGKSEVGSSKIIYNKDNCIPTHCENIYQIKINDVTYDVVIQLSQNNDEEELKLINTLVTVSLADRNIESKVEGYVNDEIFETSSE